MTETIRQTEGREFYARHVLPEVDVLLRVALSMTAQPSNADDLCRTRC